MLQSPRPHNHVLIRLGKGLTSLVTPPRPPAGAARPQIGCRRLLSRGSACAVDANAATDTGSGSARQQFRSIPVDPGVLRNLRALGLGIAPRGRRSGRPHRRTTGTASTSAPPPRPTTHRVPPPFGSECQPVTVVSSIGSLEELDKFMAKHSGLAKAVPEVALAGRSNVGKSTLLNALLYGNRAEAGPAAAAAAAPSAGRRRLPTKLSRGSKAAVSARPGETRALGVYQLATKERPPRLLRLVDLPGYGFAFAAPEAAAGYQELMGRYLLHRGGPLKRMLLLVDARHGLKRADYEFLEMLQRHLVEDPRGAAGSSSPSAVARMPAIQLVLTKCDLVDESDLARRVVQVREQLSDCLKRETSRLPVMLVSARQGLGYHNARDRERGNGGLLQLQRELAALVPSAITPPTEIC